MPLTDKDPAASEAHSPAQCHLSLIIPSYNGASLLPNSILQASEFLRQKSYSSEIIVVDDGSTDATPDVLRQHSDRIVVVRNERNRGKGYSVRRGMLAAKGEYILFTDADLPFGLEPIDTFLRYLDVKEFDLVLGARDVPLAGSKTRRPLHRKFLSRVFQSFVSRVVVTGVTDTQCGLKGFRRKAAREIFSRCKIDGFAFDVEAIYLAFKMNLDVKRCPVVLQRHDQTTVRLGRDPFLMGCDVLRIWFYYHTGQYQIDSAANERS
jgi:dolichyl-phosphate beta-glucosyltransferase